MNVVIGISIVYAIALVLYLIIAPQEKDSYKDFYVWDILFLPGYLLLFALVPLFRFLGEVLSKRIC